MEWMAKKTFTAPWFCAEQTDESWNREMNCATDAEGSSRSTTVHLPSTKVLILVSIYIIESVCLFVCLFVSDKRQNYGTD